MGPKSNHKYPYRKESFDYRHQRRKSVTREAEFRVIWLQGMPATSESLRDKTEIFHWSLFHHDPDFNPLPLSSEIQSYERINYFCFMPSSSLANNFVVGDTLSILFLILSVVFLFVCLFVFISCLFYPTCTVLSYFRGLQRVEDGEGCESISVLARLDLSHLMW